MARDKFTPNPVNVTSVPMMVKAQVICLNTMFVATAARAHFLASTIRNEEHLPADLKQEYANIVFEFVDDIYDALLNGSGSEKQVPPEHIHEVTFNERPIGDAQ